MTGLTATRRRLAGLAAVVACLIAAPSFGDDPAPINVDADGVALHGYDPVAYFTDGAATEGSPQHSAVFAGATFRFASAANREAFLADPTRFVPAYGGYCAYGAAMGRKFGVDPEAWSIVDGTLYVNLNQGVQKRWAKNPEGYIENADHNWTLIEQVADATLEASPPSGLKLGAAN